jgi:hypothetical protein
MDFVLTICKKVFFYFYFYIWIAPCNGFQWSIAYKWETLIARHGFPPICIDMWLCSGIFAFAVTKDMWQSLSVYSQYQNNQNL